MTHYTLPVIGLLFLLTGSLFLFRARNKDITAGTIRAHRKLGWIYICTGAVLAVLGLVFFS